MDIKAAVVVGVLEKCPVRDEIKGLLDVGVLEAFPVVEEDEQEVVVGLAVMETTWNPLAMNTPTFVNSVTETQATFLRLTGLEGQVFLVPRMS